VSNPRSSDARVGEQGEYGANALRVGNRVMMPQGEVEFGNDEVRKGDGFLLGSDECPR